MAAEENAYDILGLTQGPAATDVEIKKAYRKLALIKHPDKRPNDPNAAAEFNELQRAYDILTDEEGRKALDQLLRARAARAERTVIHDHKRRRMAEDLERREKAAAGLSEEAQAAARLQIEIERMRRAAMEREKKAAAAAASNFTTAAAQQHQQQQHRQSTAATPGAADAQNGAATTTANNNNKDSISETLPRTLKVSWSRPGFEYSISHLRTIFSAHGAVEDVVMREGKKRKGSALVVMDTREGARKAGDSVNGELSNPLLVIPLTKGNTSANGSGGATGAPVGHSRPVFGAPSNAPKPEKAAKMAAVEKRIFEANEKQQLGPKPVKPLFPAGAQAATARAAMTGFASFSSFQQPSGGGGGGEDASTIRRRQAEVRERVIAQMQQEEDDEDEN